MKNLLKIFLIAATGVFISYPPLFAQNAENRALNKPAFAGAAPNGFEAFRANNGNNGDRWASGSAAKHYAQVGNQAQDWWYVDLEGTYTIDSVRVLYETACPSDYDILVSNNGAVWEVLSTYNTQPTNVSQNAYEVYDLRTEAKAARYVKIFARQGYANLAYGISMWEFEVYGNEATLADSNKPSILSAAVDGEPTENEIVLAVVASDAEDADVKGFHVVDAAHSIDLRLEATDGKIVIYGLQGETTYSFVVTALDMAGNESDDSQTVVAQTAVDMSVPREAAPQPTRLAENVLPIYSDAYPTILQHPFIKQNWGSVSGAENSVEGDNFVLYDMSVDAEIIWGENNNSVNAIVAKDEYTNGGEGTGVDASGMEKLHIDIWSRVAMNNIAVRIGDQILRRIDIADTGWQQFDIELADPVEAEVTTNLQNVRWIKITEFGAHADRQKVAVDNFYFYKEPTTSGFKVNNVSSDANFVITADKTEYEAGETVELTISATVGEDYKLTSFSIDGENVEISELMPMLKVGEEDYYAASLFSQAGYYDLTSYSVEYTYKYQFTMPDHNVDVDGEFDSTDVVLAVDESENVNCTADVDLRAIYGETVAMRVFPETGYKLKSAKILEDGFEDVDYTIEGNVVSFKASGSMMVVSAICELAESKTITCKNGVQASAATAIAGDEITLTIKPTQNYRLGELKINGVTVDANDIVADEPNYSSDMLGTEMDEQNRYTYTFTMPDEDVTVTATYIQTYALKPYYTKDEVEVEAPYRVVPGETIQLKITPKEGYENVSFEAYDENYTLIDQVEYNVSDQTVVVPEELDCALVVDITADKANFSITVATYDEEAGKVIVAEKAQLGDNIQIEITVNTGYTIEEVKADGKEVKIDKDGFYIFTMPANDVVVEVSFGDDSHETNIGLNQAVAERGAVKVIENGVIYILRNGKRYNLQGAEVK